MILFAPGICIKKDGKAVLFIMGGYFSTPNRGEHGVEVFPVAFLRGLNGGSLLKKTHLEKRTMNYTIT
jgi:hypothetical protein